MASTITWLDYSERDRRRAVEVIRLFEEKGTVDELGIGSVRDAFANILFPGISTIQSRAKYFLLIPWIYRALEDKRVPSREMAARARQAELGLIDVLADSSDFAGTIGIVARKGLKNLPSEIYWAGLGTWGIRLFPGSRDAYHRSMDGFYASPSKTMVTDELEAVHGRPARNWHSGLPSPPSEFPRGVSLQLTWLEAEYLRDRILIKRPGTFLAYLVAEGQPADGVRFPWEHPQAMEAPEQNRLQLFHARCFSEAMHGSVLIYNLMLAEKRGDGARSERYRQLLDEWYELLVSRATDFQRWDRAAFWDIVVSGGGGVTTPTRLFIDAWLNIALGQRAETVADDGAARQLVHERERLLKRGYARLDNQRAL